MSNLRSRVIRLAHDHPELRHDLLPLLREAATKDTEIRESMVDDVINVAETSDHRKLKTHVAEFVHDFVALGLKYNKIVGSLVEQVEGWYPPNKVDRNLLEKKIKPVIEDYWGGDPGLDVLAKILARGRYIT